MAVCSLNFPSDYLNARADVNVILPDGSAEETYPVLWLLHGARGDHNDWMRNAPLERLANAHKMVFICPNGMSGDYCNYAQFGGGFDFPGYLFDELMPMLRRWFPLSAKPEDNRIAGFSMGGNGSLALALLRPEVFGGVGMFAGSIRDLDDLRPWRDMSSAQFRVEGYDTTRFHGIYPPGYKPKEINMIAKYPTVGDFLDSMENTWDRYIEVFQAGKLPKIYVTVGDQDRCTGRVNRFKKLAAELGDTQTVFSEIPGHVHTYDMAAIALENYIAFCGL